MEEEQCDVDTQGGVDGGNLACESVGIGKQETAGRGGRSTRATLCAKKNLTQ